MTKWEKKWTAEMIPYYMDEKEYKKMLEELAKILYDHFCHPNIDSNFSFKSKIFPQTETGRNHE